MAVIFIESRTRDEVDRLTAKEKKIRYKEQGIISLATIQAVLGNQFRITGLDSAQESSELALLLRAGALAAPIFCGGADHRTKLGGRKHPFWDELVDHRFRARNGLHDLFIAVLVDS